MAVLPLFWTTLCSRLLFHPGHYCSPFWNASSHLCLLTPVASGLNDPTWGYLPCRGLCSCHLSGWLLSPLCSFCVTMVTLPQPALFCGSRWTSDSCPWDQASWFHFVLPPARHWCFIKDDHFWESVSVRFPIKLSVPYIISSRSSCFYFMFTASSLFYPNKQGMEYF